MSHLEELPPEKPVVFAVTHLSDADLPAATAEILNYRPTNVSGLSTTHTDPLYGRLLKFINYDQRIFGIANAYDHLRKEPIMRFSKEDFEKMAKNMKTSSRDMVIAAHNSTTDWRLSKRAGIGAAYLAQLAETNVVPIALDVHSDTPTGFAADIHSEKPFEAFREFSELIKNFFIAKRKPDATLRIGAPLVFPALPAELLARPTRETLRQLEEQGNTIMKALAQMLPAEKRGKWNEITLNPEKLPESTPQS
jgi:1-acyl-sn-glycerol-3-phosphate acyltransferase